MIEQIKQNPRLKKFVIGLISPDNHPRPRWWVRWFVTPFIHTRGRGSLICRHARVDIFPWNKFVLGAKAIVEDFAVINNGAGDLLIGEGVRIGIGSVVVGPVTLGKYVGIGQHASIQGLNHGYQDIHTDLNMQPLDKRIIVVGDYTYINTNVVVVAGVTIGEHCMIGAGSVVTKDIPSYCVAVGNPARVIKQYDFAKNEWVKV
ncbi:MAG: acyltransferase [Alistipes sp.]